VYCVPSEPASTLVGTSTPPQRNSNAASVASTGSENVTATFASARGRLGAAAGRQRVLRTRRDAADAEVGRVVAGIDAARRPRQADERDGVAVRGGRAGALRVGVRRVALVGERVDDRVVLHEGDRVGRAVLDEVRVGAVVELAVGDGVHVGAHDEQVARLERDRREGDRVVHHARRAVDEPQRVRVEVDDGVAVVADLRELGRVPPDLVVIDFVDHERGRGGRGERERRDGGQHERAEGP
jgi:hypothetical protein